MVIMITINSMNYKQKQDETVLNEETKQDNLLDETVEKKKNIAAKKSTRRKRILYTIFILFNIVALWLVLFFENKSGDMLAGRKVVRILSKNFHYTIIIFAIFLVQIFVDSIAFYFLTKQVGIKKNVLLSIRTSVIGKYYDKLTPWATGGEPVQMVYLSTHGLDTPTGCAIPLAKTIIRIFTTSSTVFIVLIFSGIKVNVYITIAAYISLAANLFFPTLFIVFVRHKEWGQKVTRGVIRLLCKLKLVKDFDAQYAKFSIMVENFLKGIGYLSAHKKMIVIVALMTLIELFAINSVPFFIMKAFAFSNVNYWEILVLCLFVTYASYFAPSPGSAGIAELSFYAIFASVITGNYLFWAILLWRIVSYYLPILSGIILQVSEGITTLINKKKGTREATPHKI